MSEYLFDQLDFARNATLRALEGLSESDADIVPEGFNNNIRWNLGHVYLVQEQFAFAFAQEPVQIPEGFKGFFGGGTKPLAWEGQPPALSELTALLKEQPKRIRERLQGRLDEAVAKPFSIPGLSLNTIGQLLNFTLFHEGGHMQNIKNIRKLASK